MGLNFPVHIKKVQLLLPRKISGYAPDPTLIKLNAGLNAIKKNLALLYEIIRIVRFSVSRSKKFQKHCTNITSYIALNQHFIVLERNINQTQGHNDFKFSFFL